MGKELLFSLTRKDFKIDFFSGTGAGGQKRNKTQNCVRLHHIETGIIVTGQSARERKANIAEAFKNLIKNPKFKLWHARKALECIEGKTIEEKVEQSMSLENLIIEVQKDGKWISESEIDNAR